MDSLHKILTPSIKSYPVLWAIQGAYLFDFFGKKVEKGFECFRNFWEGPLKATFVAFLGHFFRNFGNKF